MKMIKRKSAFTLVELLVVVAILGLLAVGVVLSINPASKIATTKTNNSNASVKTVAGAIETCITNELGTGVISTDAQAIYLCRTATILGITVGTDQVLTTSPILATTPPTITSICFSSKDGAGTYSKYVHTGGAGTYYSLSNSTPNASSAACGAAGN